MFINQSEVSNDRVKVNNKHSRSRSTEQAVSHTWKNLNILVPLEVCADDVVQKIDERSTTKQSILEAKTPSLSGLQCCTISTHLLISNNFYNIY